MKKILLLIVFVLFLAACGQQTEEGIDFEYEPDPVLFDRQNDGDRPYQERWVNDGERNRIQNPRYEEGEKERNLTERTQREGFESQIDPRPGIGSPEKRDGDSINNTTELQALLDEVVELTNREREVNGLSNLEIDMELQDAAQEKATDMAYNDYFDHNSPTYGSPSDMLQQFDVEHTVVLENIAAGFLDPEDVVNGWMKSEGHRENILNEDVTHIGIGYEEGGAMDVYWTQLFIAK